MYVYPKLFPFFADNTNETIRIVIAKEGII